MGIPGFCGDIPLHRPKIYGIGTSNQSDPESWPLIVQPSLTTVMTMAISYNWLFHVI